ncbi:MAG: NYN domain-containing protein, partial [Hyphomicrobium sp.]
MRRESSGPILTTIFVDYDNIYMSLRRKSEEAAKRFAKDASVWLRELETGRLITPTNGVSPTMPRRIVMNRCYGNPVPRRNNSDNSTDMNSFPFVRHHFLRSGFEIIDCPPLTAQLKNSSDIRMVMDVRDLLGHDTYFDEFIILSGDADFTPVLHRLRAHARRTVIFANDHTAAPYTSISDGEVRESDLISLLLEGRLSSDAEPNSLIETASAASASGRVPSITQIEVQRRELISEVAALVRQAGQPVPLEALADRLVRTLGHEKTVASGWAGSGSFRDLLSRALPGELRLSSEPPYYVFDAALKTPEPAAPLPAPSASEPPARLSYAEPRYEEPQQRLAAQPAQAPIQA